MRTSTGSSDRSDPACRAERSRREHETTPDTRDATAAAGGREEAADWRAVLPRLPRAPAEPGRAGGGQLRLVRRAARARTPVREVRWQPTLGRGRQRRLRGLRAPRIQGEGVRGPGVAEGALIGPSGLASWGPSASPTGRSPDLRRLRRLLLRQAVQRAEAQHQVDRVDADDRPVLEQLAENAQGDAVVRVVEGRAR